jgi:uncharacterized protein
MQTTSDTRLSDQERDILLRIARDSISAAVSHTPLPEIDIEKQPSALQAHGACFVTLTKEGGLRGCIGTMEPHQPLIKDVQEHAVAAAMSDYRFPKVRPEELDRIKIEISRLMPLRKLPYNGEDQLLKSLRIGIDGVLISAGGRRATFLPQVWEQLPQPEQFLSHLCQKMGAASDCWKDQHLEVYTYQVEKFCEK